MEWFIEKRGCWRDLWWDDLRNCYFDLCNLDYEVWVMVLWLFIKVFCESEDFLLNIINLLLWFLRGFVVIGLLIKVLSWGVREMMYLIFIFVFGLWRGVVNWIVFGFIVIWYCGLFFIKVIGGFSISSSGFIVWFWFFVVVGLSEGYFVFVFY